MAIPKRMNIMFDQLVQAAEDGCLCLIQSKDRHSGATRYVLASVDRENGLYLVCPFGHLSEDPFGEYVSPADDRSEASDRKERSDG